MDTPKSTQDLGPETDEPAVLPAMPETSGLGPDLEVAGDAPQGDLEASADQVAETATDDEPDESEQVAEILADEAEPAAEPDEPGFAALGLSPEVAQAVADLGYETPTPVQRQCIPHLLEGRDLLGQAQTGTGKTAAFALPLLSRIDPTAKEPQVLVLTPTRELALQVAEAFQRYAHNIKDFHVLPIYGGQSYGLQVRQLQRVPQVIVGTPGRIMDHMRRNTLSLEGLKTLVLDEADEMLNMGFAEDIDWIFEHTPADRQVALFSATMPAEILRVARDHLIDPVEIRIESATATVDTIDQQHCVVTRFHKVDVLTRILELEPFDGMLVFVRTKGGTTELVDKLRSQGFAAEALNGDMSQELRERTVDRLKGGQLDILVATDVAARGLDVERVSHVVNFDIPMDPSAYVHRIGRTGRAGRAGKAILLVEPRERGLLRAIERTIRRPIPEMAPPSAAQLSATRIDRFIEQIRETVAGQDLDFFFRLMARISKEQELEPMNIAAALGFLIQRERPLEVKDPPREQRREYRDDRPRGQDRGGRYQDRGQDRGERRFGGEREGNRPPRDRDQAGPARPYESRAPREGGYDRPREGNRDDRPFRSSGDRPFRPDRDARPAGDRPFRPEPGNERPFRPEPGNERPFRPDRDGNRAPFESRDQGRDRGERPFRPQGESWQDRPRGYDRDARRDDRGNSYPRPAPAHDAPPARDRDGYRDRIDPPREGFRDGPRPPRREGGRGGSDLVRHRIEVGHRDGVTPREIVGAIANESGLEGRFIGQIDIQDDHSIVDLPAGMPHEVMSHLRRVFVRGQALRISVLDAPPRGPGGPRRDDDRPPRPPRDDDRGPRPPRFGGDDGAPRGPRPDQGFRRKRKD